MNDTTVSILGCGWMGLPLARHLVRLGYAVKGSTTSPDKLPILERSKVKPFLIKAAPQMTGQDLEAFFQSKILFLNIPFRRSLKDPRSYKQQLDAVAARVATSPVEFVIFASSTSVYPASLKEALEDVSFIPDNPRSKVLREAVQMFLTNSHFETTVIRFAGLYGGTRQIGRILAGRAGLPDAQGPVNLIHLDDCVDIVARIIAKDIRGEIFNACSDGHPARKDIYTEAAGHFGLEPPQFSHQPQIRFKIVSNAKLKERLGYAFKHPDPLDF